MQPDIPVFVGNNRVVRNLNRMIDQLAPTPEWLWIIGETGTGKGLVARRIHSLSGLGGRFVEVNSARLRSALTESTLFGHTKGAFTGAVSDMKGRYAQADGGTLFFPEGARTRRRAQGLLLELLDQRGYSPVGDARLIQPVVRVLFATSVEPLQLLKGGNLEEHFFYRLGTIYVRIPPLRDRLGDIPELVAHFLGRRALLRGISFRPWPDASLDALMQYGWPGNVRQLENVLAAAETLAVRNGVTRMLVENLLSQQPCWPSEPRDRAANDDTIVEKLKANRGNVARTARQVGKCENTIRRLLAARGITAEDLRVAG